MKNRKLFLVLIVIWIMVSLACNLPGSAAGRERLTQTAAVTQTNVAATSAAGMTPSPEQPNVVASNTPAPQSPTITGVAPTNIPTSTITQLPCNWVQYIADINYPDDTNVETGQSFTKTWRLKNIGSCDWTSGYQLIFVSGDQMNAPAAVQLPSGVVPPGGTVDISVPLKAPTSPGTYKGFFQLRSASGQNFGIGATANGSFWVQIVAVSQAASATPVVEAKADLYVSEFSLSPATPVQGSPVHVRVGVYNKGTAKAEAYTVKWWGLSTFTDPSCTWNVPSTNAKGGRILECDFTFASWYPTKITRVIVDTDNTINESDETNNTGDYPITVTAP